MIFDAQANANNTRSKLIVSHRLVPAHTHVGKRLDIVIVFTVSFTVSNTSFTVPRTATRAKLFCVPSETPIVPAATEPSRASTCQRIRGPSDTNSIVNNGCIDTTRRSVASAGNGERYAVSIKSPKNTADFADFAAPTELSHLVCCSRRTLSAYIYMCHAHVVGRNKITTRASVADESIIALLLSTHVSSVLCVERVVVFAVPAPTQISPSPRSSAVLVE